MVGLTVRMPHTLGPLRAAQRVKPFRVGTWALCGLPVLDPYAAKHSVNPQDCPGFLCASPLRSIHSELTMAPWEFVLVHSMVYVDIECLPKGTRFKTCSADVFDMTIVTCQKCCAVTQTWSEAMSFFGCLLPLSLAVLSTCST